MRSLTNLILIILLILGLCKAEKQCEWTQASYDAQNYLRVIKKPIGDVPLLYLCWEKKKLDSPIFADTENCELAILDVKGLICGTCVKGFKTVEGSCVKVEKEKEEEKKKILR